MGSQRVRPRPYDPEPTSRQREWVEAYTRLRWKVCSARSREEVNAAVRYFKRRTDTKAAAYVLAYCSPHGSPKEIVRKTLSGAVPILYIGASDTEERCRASNIACSLTDGALSHDAIGYLLDDYPAYLKGDCLTLIVCSFSPAYSLEGFWLGEHIEAHGRRPILNRGPSTRPSTNIIKKPREVTWELLTKPWLEVESSPAT